MTQQGDNARREKEARMAKASADFADWLDATSYAQKNADFAKVMEEAGEQYMEQRAARAQAARDRRDIRGA